MIQVEGIFTGGGSVTSAPIMGTDFTWTGGDNTCMVLDDGDGNWRIKFLSSGIFTPLKNMVIDVFLVGGGGPGKSGSKSGSTYRGAGGGGSGYTTTARSVVLAANTAYQITVGAGGAINTASGGDTTAFGATASGGKAPNTTTDYRYGGNGGSGGGMAGGNTGGSDGSDGAGSASYAGKGQGTTTREFGETDGDLYAGAGAGGGGGSTASSAATVIAGGAGGGGDSASNTRAATPGEDGKGGGGGGGSCTSSDTRTGAPGGSGICIIRNHREEAAA